MSVLTWFSTWMSVLAFSEIYEKYAVDHAVSLLFHLQDSLLSFHHLPSLHLIRSSDFLEFATVEFSFNIPEASIASSKILI